MKTGGNAGMGMASWGTVIEGGICAPAGFRAAGVACGLKGSGDLDLCLLAAVKRCAAAGVFTTNAFKAAPVLVTMEHLRRSSHLWAVVANSGNANAWTGDAGIDDARAMANCVAESLGVSPAEVAVASTGVIGSPLPLHKVKEGIAEAAGRLGSDGGGGAARAIMTTDTRPKEVAMRFDGFTVAGMAKGAGMIRPDMATMLAFITTDAQISPPELGRALKGAVDRSFNLITVDGCTSTNDMVLALASGMSRKSLSSWEMEGPLHEVCSVLARAIVEDGEGATRFVVLRLHGAAEDGEAKRAAMAVAESPLVKTAFFGGDPNWGRVVQALGQAVKDADPGKVKVIMGGVTVAEGGKPVRADVRALREIMAAQEVEVDIYLGRGKSEVEVWTCDLSHDYVSINADYHT
jgi:glutamate N-acetyltransferase/amino-acid N-acetyltransferase